MIDTAQPGDAGQLGNAHQQQRGQQHDQQQRQTRSRLQANAQQASDKHGQPVQGERLPGGGSGPAQTHAASVSPAIPDGRGDNLDGAADLRPPGDVAVLDRFRNMEGDAWKVFYMASRMGVRPDVIQKAAARFRTLHQE